MKWTTCIREHQNIQARYAALRRIARKLKHYDCPEPDVCTVGTLAWYLQHDDALPIAQVYLKLGSADEFCINTRKPESTEINTRTASLSDMSGDETLKIFSRLMHQRFFFAGKMTSEQMSSIRTPYKPKTVIN